MRILRFLRRLAYVLGLSSAAGRLHGYPGPRGARGFHYTIRSTAEIGSAEDNEAKGMGPIHAKAQDLAMALAWARSQEETCHINLPDLHPDENPATPKQLKTIHGLVYNVEGVDPAYLGEKQAAFLIREIEKEKALLTWRKVRQYLGQHRARSAFGLRWIIFLIVILIIALLVFVGLHR